MQDSERQVHRMKNKSYLIIDLKSFYASCECVMRGLDPMTTDLVVADAARGRGTICLAVSPSLKAKGVRNRCRIFEIPSRFRYIMATPRMQLYLNYSAEIYSIYLDYFCKNDIFVYSVDEAFIDITGYTQLYHKTPHEMARFLLCEIEQRLGLPASCGIGTNLYLAKIALDITAKHAPDRIGRLDEETFRRTLWQHTPLTDFWRIGHGIERRLQRMGLFTMGDVAHAPYKAIRKAFGIDGYLLYDHAWGREPTTIAEIHAYRPETQSVSEGQVLLRDYSYTEARVVLVEMADQLALRLTSRHVVASSVTMCIVYSSRPDFCIPPASGTVRIDTTNASSKITTALLELYTRIVLTGHPIRRILLCANHVEPEAEQELSLFTPPEAEMKERARQQATLYLQQRFGKNALLRATDLLEAATRRQRNEQIGGHKAYGDKETVEPRKNLPAIRRPAGAAGAPARERDRARGTV